MVPITGELPDVNLLQVLIVIFGLATIVLASIRFKNFKEKRWLRIPVIFAMVHLLVYYAYYFAATMGADLPVKAIRNGSWTIYLRVQMVLTFLMLEWYGFTRDKRGNCKGKGC